MEHVPAEFAADSGDLPEIAGGVLATARIWTSDGIAEGYFHPSGDPGAKKPYCGLDGLLLGLEELAETQGRPRREKLRCIPGVPRKPYRSAYCTADGSVFTVSVRICFGQHCSMQGELCLQGGQKVRFRSALELLFLLRQVAEQLEEKEEIGKKIPNT